ncbi:hypothetical protein HY449_01450 [Candidatus Pacearchaeota archaeon]|nr:hypothetical protein [Candidatus Pacearchaeota archaeon]
MKKGKSKSGEITTQQIVILIILIVSFVVILFLLFRLNLGKQTGVDLCRNSVILKGNSVLPKDTIKLDCYRSYKCLTFDGSCEGLNNPEIAKVKTANEVYKNLADEMAQCWSMFGEGKVNYAGDDLTKNNYCSICSQIIFDDSLNKINEFSSGKISKDFLYDYLSKTKINSGKTTYAQYLFGTNDLEKLKSESQKNGVGTFGTIQTGNQFFVVMGITSGVSPWEWAGIGGVGGSAIAGTGIAITAVALTTPPGWIAGAVLVGAGALGATGGAIFSDNAAELLKPEILAITVNGNGISNKFMAPTVVEANSEKFKALNCKEILTYS